MDIDFGKVWLAGFGTVGGAIAGAWIWAQRAAAVASRKAQDAGDDALIEVARNTGVNSLGAALQGAFVGGIIGLILVIAYFYFSDPDRRVTPFKSWTKD
jgi:hypothetical protein